MNILGIHYGGHDAGACVMVPARQPVAIALERLDRIKYSGCFTKGWREKFPSNLRGLVEYCLRGLGAAPGDIKFDLVLHTILPVEDSQFRALLRPYTETEAAFVQVGHHMAHASSAFFASPFEDSAIMVIDGEGDRPVDHLYVSDLPEKQSLYRGTGNRVTQIRKTYGSPEYPYGLGEAYEIVTYLLGFRPLEGGKTMGLAPYGKGCMFRDFSVFKTFADGHVLMDRDVFHWSEYMKWGYEYDLDDAWQIIRGVPSKFGKARGQGDILPSDYYNEMAYKIQTDLEEAVLALARDLYDITRANSLCIAGGVGLNCITNKRICDETPFDEVFVQPAASDTGLALGVSLYGKHIIQESNDRWVMHKACLGREYSRQEVQEALGASKGIKVDYYGDDSSDPYFCSTTPIFVKTAQLLAEGAVLGWFQGGCELGPRALGHRSVLADPRNAEVREIVNSKVKHRESFRPFAPSILIENASEYYDLNYPSPFMTLIAKTKPGMGAKIPAVTHVDGTGRVQTLTLEDNCLYCRLVKEFCKITGVPVILNTSFNIAGEPIVESPADAVDTFLRTNMDCVVIHNYVVQRD